MMGNQWKKVECMKKIAFVCPWYGDAIKGGAEAELRGIAKHMAASGVDVEIITTTVKEFTADWSKNYYKTGVTEEGGLAVRRFKVRKRDVRAFDAVNEKLMNNRLPLSEEDEETYFREMVNSPDLYAYIRENKEAYGLFVFIPYMFGTTYYGIQECYEKAVIIPCLHDESYIYMNKFQQKFPKVAGMIFHAQPECDLAKKVYGLEQVNTKVLGEGVDTGMSYDAEAFRKKYKISEPFILYAGRKDAGKNIYTLINYFREYKKRIREGVLQVSGENAGLKLLLLGGGEVTIPEDCKDDILDLGFVSVEDKFNAYGAATVLCQPSEKESFSLVVMESWLCKRPVLVSGKCNVTRHFASVTNGGLYFENYPEFQETVNYLATHQEQADQMGENGYEFVMNNFAWDVIVERYTEYFKGLMDRCD